MFITLFLYIFMNTEFIYVKSFIRQIAVFIIFVERSIQ